MSITCTLIRLDGRVIRDLMDTKCQIQEEESRLKTTNHVTGKSKKPSSLGHMILLQYLLKLWKVLQETNLHQNLIEAINIYMKISVASKDW